MNMDEENYNIRFSVALFIPFIWFFIATTRNISEWIPGNITYYGGTDRYIEGSPADRIFFTTLMMIGILILWQRKSEVKIILDNNKLLICFFLYLLISIGWSEFQYVALKRWFKLFGSLMMVLIIKTEDDDIESSFWIMRKIFYIHLLLSLIAIKFFRSYGIMWEKDGSSYMWTGLSTHKNELGQLLMLSNLYFIYEIYFKKKYNMKSNKDNNNEFIYKDKIYCLFLLLGLFLMFAGPGYSKSATSIMTLVAGLIVMYVLSRYMNFEVDAKNKFLKIIIICLCMFLLVNLVTFAIFDQSVYDIVLQVQGRDESFTGRTDLWIDILQIAKNKLFLGVGYGSFWIGGIANNLWETHIWRPTQAHNGYIDVLVETGIVGVVLLIIYIFNSYNKLIETGKKNQGYAIFAITILTMIVIHNGTESSFLRGTHALWFVFLLFTVNK